jgi:hypothetical protein
MNQENNVKFCVNNLGDELSVEIEGSRMDIITVLATVMDESEDLQMMVEIALAAVKAKSAGEVTDEEIIERLSKIKPIAQA